MHLFAQFSLSQFTKQNKKHTLWCHCNGSLKHSSFRDKIRAHSFLGIPSVGGKLEFIVFWQRVFCIFHLDLASASLVSRYVHFDNVNHSDSVSEYKVLFCSGP